MKDIGMLIEEKGLKKKFVADRLNMRPETFSRKLKNPETFSAIQMCELSKLLGVEIYKLDFKVKFFKQKHELNSSKQAT